MPDEPDEKPIAQQIEDVAAAIVSAPPDEDAKRERDILYRQKKRTDPSKKCCIGFWLVR